MNGLLLYIALSLFSACGLNISTVQEDGDWEKKHIVSSYHDGTIAFSWMMEWGEDDNQDDKRFIQVSNAVLGEKTLYPLQSVVIRSAQITSSTFILFEADTSPPLEFA